MRPVLRAGDKIWGRIAGLLLALGLTACVSSGAPQTVAERQITPEEFFNAFNMRSIETYMWPFLDYYCGSYPKDYFNNRGPDKRLNAVLKDEGFAELGKNLLVLTPVENGEDLDQVWLVYFKGDNKIELNERVRSGIINTFNYYTLYFDGAHGDWRMKSGEFWDAVRKTQGVVSSVIVYDTRPDCVHRG